MLSDTLDTLLGTTISLIGIVISLYVVVRFISKKKESLPIEAINHLSLVFFLLWFILYAIATKMELDEMKLVFQDHASLPGLSLSYGLLAIAFTIFFALLIITHRNLYITYPVLMLLGFSDLHGNLNLMTGMQHIFQEHLKTETDISVPMEIWIDYYLSNDHLVRIEIYMFIAYLGFVIFLLSRFRLRTENVHKNNETKTTLEQISELCNEYKISLEVIGRMVVILALIYNEVTIWSWRYERESNLLKTNNTEYSSYQSWSVSDMYKFVPNKALEPDPTKRD